MRPPDKALEMEEGKSYTIMIGVITFLNRLELMND